MLVASHLRDPRRDRAILAGSIVALSALAWLSLWAWSASPWGRSLAVAIAANAAVAAWYYLRLIALLFREPAPGEPPRRIAFWPAAAGAAAALSALAIFAAPQALWDLAEQIVR